jgi:hypothetical protein
MKVTCRDSNVRSGCVQVEEFLALVSVISSSILELRRMITEYKVNKMSISKIYSPRNFIIKIFVFFLRIMDHTILNIAI